MIYKRKHLINFIQKLRVLDSVSQILVEINQMHLIVTRCHLFKQKQEFLICWYESPPETSLTISRNDAIELRKIVKPFIDWLKTAEEED